jgi:hypothetical protein
MILLIGHPDIMEATFCPFIYYGASESLIHILCQTVDKQFDILHLSYKILLKTQLGQL